MATTALVRNVDGGYETSFGKPRELEWQFIPTARCRILVSKNYEMADGKKKKKRAKSYFSSTGICGRYFECRVCSINHDRTPRMFVLVDYIYLHITASRLMR